MQRSNFFKAAKASFGEACSTPMAMDRSRCAGTVFERLDDLDWEFHCSGHVVAYPIETVWLLSPLGIPVAVQSGSLESLLCRCAAGGYQNRILLLIHSPEFTEHVHPAALADAYLYLQRQADLTTLLMQSIEARVYVSSLVSWQFDSELLEWAQRFCKAMQGSYFEHMNKTGRTFDAWITGWRGGDQRFDDPQIRLQTNPESAP